LKIGQRNDLPARAAKRIVATIFARSSFKADDPKYDPRAEALNKPVRQYLEDDFSRLIWEEMLVAEGERFETFVEAAFCVASAVVLERLEKFGVDSGVFWGGEQCWGWLDNLSVNQLRIGPDYLSALELVTDAVFTKPTVQLLYRSIELFSRHPVLPFRSFRS
jgi:hypothetical protein